MGKPTAVYCTSVLRIYSYFLKWKVSHFWQCLPKIVRYLEFHYSLPMNIHWTHHSSHDHMNHTQSWRKCSATSWGPCGWSPNLKSSYRHQCSSVCLDLAPVIDPRESCGLKPTGTDLYLKWWKVVNLFLRLLHRHPKTDTWVSLTTLKCTPC